MTDIKVKSERNYVLDCPECFVRDLRSQMHAVVPRLAKSVLIFMIVL